MLRIEVVNYTGFCNRLAGAGPLPGSVGAVPFRLSLRVSVAQLAYLLKVFFETGIIRNRNLIRLLGFVAMVVHTKKAEQVSTASLRAKYYGAEASSKLAVRAMLEEMVEFIDRDER